MADDTSTPNRNAAFFPIGITFLAVGIVFLMGPTPALGWAFLPIGITFFVLGLAGRQQAGDDDGPEPTADGGSSDNSSGESGSAPDGSAPDGSGDGGRA